MTDLFRTLDLDNESAIGRVAKRMELRASLADAEQHDAFAQYLRVMSEELRREGITEVNRLELDDIADHFARLGDMEGER